MTTPSASSIGSQARSRDCFVRIISSRTPRQYWDRGDSGSSHSFAGWRDLWLETICSLDGRATLGCTRRCSWGGCHPLPRALSRGSSRWRPRWPPTPHAWEASTLNACQGCLGSFWPRPPTPSCSGTTLPALLDYPVVPSSYLVRREHGHLARATSCLSLFIREVQF